MLEALADPILPVFSVLAVGLFMARFGLFEASHAAAINRFVFYIGAPSLVFIVIATAPLSQLNLLVLAAYFLVEITVFATVTFIARRFFSVSRPESILLGMAAVFSNHVFFVRPIAILVYGADHVYPVGGIVLLDVVIFCATVFFVESSTGNQDGKTTAFQSLIRNPFIYAPIFGALAWWLTDIVPSGVFTFAHFTASAAAPVSLFALGIVLASHPIRPVGGLVFTVVGAKLVLLPVLVGALVLGAGVTGDWADIPILVAAGPCGAMPFVIATQYGVNTERLSKAILISTVLSVFTLAVLVP